ncbi:MAG: hypothetical protein GY851_35540 [bacterium]|nr:hypothetical protein [bacterium]
MMGSELRANTCPCGASPAVTVEANVGYYVHCYRCWRHGPKGTRDEAVNGWNELIADPPSFHDELQRRQERIREIAKHGLCWRCEWRVQNWESGRQPRAECGNVLSAVCSCYMYRPVSPCLQSVPEAYRDDPRPDHGPAMLAKRMQRDGTASVAYHLHRRPDGRSVVYAVPEQVSKAPTHYLTEQQRAEWYTPEARCPHTRRGWVAPPVEPLRWTDEQEVER